MTFFSSLLLHSTAGTGKMRTCGLADLRTDQRVNCRPNLRTRSTVYPLVGPQVCIICISLSSLLLTFVL